MVFDSVKVRFRNNKPFLFKKIFITAFFLGLFIYFVTNLPLIVSVIIFLCVGLPMFFKIRKQPTEGRGFFGKVKSYYKNLYKDYVIDYLPFNIDVNADEINIVLRKAEIIKRKTVDEYFNIKKNDIAGILYDDIDNDILIMFQKSEVIAKCNETIKRKSIQTNATICFHIVDEKIVELFLSNNYEIERLSEIHDEEEETEDPELVQKSENNNSAITNIVSENNDTMLNDKSVMG